MEVDETIRLSFWVEDYSEKVVFKSSKTHLQSNGECMWDDQFKLLGASQLENPYFRFKFFQHIRNARLFWFFKDFLCSSLACGSEGFLVTGCSTPSLKRKTIKTSGKCQEWAFDMMLRIEAHYNAEIQYRDMAYANYNVLNVTAYFEDALVKGKMREVRERDNHRIVCLAQIYKRTKSNRMQQNAIYLGRAQNIETTTGYNPRDRVYTWVLGLEKDQPAFPGFIVKREEFWPFHKEQHDDMLKLKIYNQPLSARFAENKKKVAYSPDSDDYSNLLKVPPIHVGAEEDLVFYFYNMEENSGHPLEIYLRRGNFSTQKKDKLKRHTDSVQMFVFNQEIGKNLSVFVEYMISSSKEIVIYRIKLIANNYLDSLYFRKLVGFSKMKSI